MFWTKVRSIAVNHGQWNSIIVKLELPEKWWLILEDTSCIQHYIIHITFNQSEYVIIYVHIFTDRYYLKWAFTCPGSRSNVVWQSLRAAYISPSL